MNIDKGKEFIKLLYQKEELENQLKELNKTIAIADQELYNDMVEQGLDKVEIEGLTLQPVVDDVFKLNGNELKWDDENGPFFKWLESIGEDGLIKLKKSVHFKTRESFLRNWKDEGRDLPAFIEQDVYAHVKYNKSEISRRVKA